ncbi:MAG: hypothetical protein KJZ47_07005 [Gemmatimonadales bacterium]|nr:hypothetical protein [Gemmatimonadales bacterium]
MATSLADFLYALPAPSRAPLAVIKWWESRRLAYNYMVGSAGLVTLAAISMLKMLPGGLPGGGPPAGFLLGGALVYGVLANLCYFLGPIAELLCYRLLGEDAPRVGPVLYRQGLSFSIGLTLLPILLFGIGSAIGLVVRIFG